MPKKRDKFLDMILTIAQNVEEAATYFLEYKITGEKNLREFSRVIKDYETKGDDYIHDLIVALNKTFITPLEREDILALAMKLDDVLDGMDQWSSRIEVYNITDPDDYMVMFVEKINLAVKEMALAAELLSGKKLLEIRKYVIKINEYESDCDNLLQESIRHLFTMESNPIRIIQYKELYEMLETIADSCEDVANTFESIIMRNV